MGDRDESARALVEGVREFERRLLSAIEGRAVGWYRLIVKVDRGKISKIQIQTDDELFGGPTLG